MAFSMNNSGATSLIAPVALLGREETVPIPTPIGVKKLLVHTNKSGVKWVWVSGPNAHWRKKPA